MDNNVFVPQADYKVYVGNRSSKTNFEYGSYKTAKEARQAMVTAFQSECKGSKKTGTHVNIYRNGKYYRSCG